MAKTNLNFYRVSTWPSTAVIGGIYFNYSAKLIRVAKAASGDNMWEDYGGTVTDATFTDNVLTISKANGSNITLDFSDVPSASGVNSLLAGLRTDINNLQTGTGLADGETAPSWVSSGSAALKATTTLKAGVEAVDAAVAAEASAAIHGFKVNGTELTKDASNKVNVTITTGDASGNIKVNGTDVAVKGLKSAAYLEETTLNAYAAEKAKDASTDAIDYAKAITVNGKTQTEKAIVVDGGDIKLTGYVKGTDKSDVSTGDTVNGAIAKLENRIEDAVAGGLQAVEAGAGIAVSAISSNKQTISVNVKSGDKILTADVANGLSTAMTFTYDSSNRKILLYGSAEDASHKIGEVDCNDFIKDGMLSDQIVATPSATSMEVTFPKGRKHTYEGLTVGHPYLFLEFNNDGTYTYDKCDLHSLVDVYTAGDGLQFNSSDDHKFEVKVASGNEYLTVSSAGVNVNDASIKAMAQAKADKALFDASTDASARIANLNYTSIGTVGSYVQKVTESNGVINETIVAFDSSINADSSVNAPTAAAVKAYVDNALTWATWE